MESWSFHLEAPFPQLQETARWEKWTYETMVERALSAELDGRDSLIFREASREPEFSL
jgi:hypothetical protein